ncbi:DNA methyltransferase [Thermotoga sp. SG1]|uniref:DNA methyltransferase n=1 Tax=Thermotoga sp. SG1 TaxID=126739 RepID=UPI000C78DA4A|nr:DNA methyltransferase [Thermotoga sp. SG1]PLV55738.1 hypothetical protein AS006_08890 [Thermotoga sp. SG1]
MHSENREEVLFRDIVDLESTTYVTHGLYGYPAKFIPHVVRYAIENYTQEGDWIFDPFSGHGTVGIEATLTGRNAILWDLNPITKVLALASTYKGNIDPADFELDWDYKKPFHPNWERIDYWYPEEFYKVLSKAWGYWHYEIFQNASESEKVIAYIIAIPLLKVTRYFSFSDEKISKLYKSKYAIQKVEQLMKNNWFQKMEEMYWRNVYTVLKKLREYREYGPKDVELEIFTSEKRGNKLVVCDSLNQSLHREVKLLITSPPYLQSQEYIRSFKLELAWLGYSGQDIRTLTRHEIPYNKIKPVKINSDTFYALREKVVNLRHPKLLHLYDTYFRSLVQFFNTNHSKIEIIAIFVGPAKIRHLRIPIDEILKEHLESLGFSHEKTLVDTIVARRMFSTKFNPATGLEDERTPTEHLLIMRR